MLELIITNDLWFNFLKTIWPSLPQNTWNSSIFLYFYYTSVLCREINQFPHAHCQQNAKLSSLPNTLWAMNYKKSKLQDAEKIQQSLNLPFHAAGFLLLTWCGNFDHLSQKLVSNQCNVCSWNSPFIHPRPICISFIVDHFMDLRISVTFFYANTEPWTLVYKTRPVHPTQNWADLSKGKFLC